MNLSRSARLMADVTLLTVPTIVNGGPTMLADLSLSLVLPTLQRNHP
jgi:hypothetical protein